jgi:hypothetical protein
VNVFGERRTYAGHPAELRFGLRCAA